MIKRNSEAESLSFVDYIPPPPTPLPPPAKYKLWLLVLTLVFFAEWFSNKANFLGWILSWGILSYDASFFLMLFVIVVCLTYAGLDLMVILLTVEVHGKKYGLGPWLRKPKAQWVHRYNNFPMQLIATVVGILENGFEMFNPPPLVKASPTSPKQYSCVESDKDVVLKIEHRINPQKRDKYCAWQKKICKAVRSVDGFKSVEITDHQSSAAHDVIDSEEANNKGSNGTENNSLFVYVTFESIDSLNDWMTSPVRDKLVKELEPLLLQPDVYQIQRNRILPDAFTDLLTRQGETVPLRLPKKWKVTWLTTIGLYFCLLWTNSFLPFYFAAWGIDNTHERVQGLVSAVINTFINSYIMTPLLLFLFSDWMARRESEIDNQEPWRTLNDGIRPIWLKVILFVSFYGGCVVAWVVNN